MVYFLMPPDLCFERDFRQAGRVVKVLVFGSRGLRGKGWQRSMAIYPNCRRHKSAPVPFCHCPRSPGLCWRGGASPISVGGEVSGWVAWPRGYLFWWTIRLNLDQQRQLGYLYPLGSGCSHFNLKQMLAFAGRRKWKGTKSSYRPRSQKIG